MIVGVASGSLALLSDAGHMAADVVALGAALLATRIATRGDITGRRTDGSYRALIFASGLAVVLMLGVAAYIVIEAIGRLTAAPTVASVPLLVVGALGLLVNVVGLVLLRGAAKESLNLKGAYLEVFADALGSVGVIAAGVLVAVTGSPWWDTIIALAIAVFVAVRAVVLGREILAVLGQHAPADIHPADAEAALRAVPGVAEVHDLHLWTLTCGMNVATAHVVSETGADQAHILNHASAIMRDRFGISHATLQLEPPGSAACQGVSW